MSNQVIPEELHYKLSGLLGEYEIINNYRPRSNRTGVWKIKSKQKFYYVKTYSRKSRWHPEVYAYQNWIKAIAPYAPELIEVFEEENWQGILISALPGIPMREANLSAIQMEKAYFKAGELTRLLHSKFKGNWFGRPDKNGNPIEIYHHNDPVCYVKNSLLEMYNKGLELNCYNADEIRLAEWALQNVEVFKDSIPVPISWDSTPGNWLVDEDGNFTGMIDFENMLWGIDVDNFTILFERYFPDCPNGKDAFFRGYGADVLENKELMIKIVCIKMGLGDILWGLENNEDRNVKLGRNMLLAMSDI